MDDFDLQSNIKLFVSLKVQFASLCVLLGFAGREVLSETQRTVLIWINSAIKQQALAQNAMLQRPTSPRTPPFHCFRSNRGEKNVEGEIKRGEGEKEGGCR